MKKSSVIIPFILSWLWQPAALALEPSATVKVLPVLNTKSSWDGKPIEYPAGNAEVRGMVVEIAPGGETGWHRHPVPSVAMLLEGELEIELKSGAVKRLKTGEALAEVVNTLHNGRNVGSVPARLVVFYVGAEGQQQTLRE